MPDDPFENRLRASLTAKADTWSPAARPLPVAAPPGRPVALVAVAAAVAVVLTGGVGVLATRGGSGRSTISAAPVSLPTVPPSPPGAFPGAAASPSVAPVFAGPSTLPSATAGAVITRDPAQTPDGADGSSAPTRPSPSGRPSPSPSPTGVTRTLGPPSEDYALHGRLALDGGEFEMVPSTVPPVASAAAVMRAYRALSTSQAAYAAAKPTFKYGVLWKACCATELKPRLGTIVWIVGNDTVEVHGSGPASARGQKPPGPVTSHGAYSVFDGTTGAVLIGFTD